MPTLLKQMIGASCLNAQTYEQVEADRTSTAGAVFVVIVANIAAAIGSLPLVGVPIFLCVTVWMLFAFVVAIRQALDYGSSARALAVCVSGWLISGLLVFGFVQIAI